MENRTQIITSANNKNISIGVIPGHFATNHSHINYYVDLNSIKTGSKMAIETAKLLASKYTHAPIDTIICFEGTQVLGAYIAQELSNNTYSVNGGKNIDIITPEMNSNNQMIFRDDAQKKVWGKQILLLISSVSTGWTVDRFVQCLNYYNGKLSGIAAVFSAVKEIVGMPVNAVFTPDDIQGYNTFPASDCPMCKENRKVDAIVNSFGYSKI